MTDKQARDIVYAIVIGAIIIAWAIRPPHWSTFDFVISFAVVALIVVGLLLFWLWETGWLLPVTVALLVTMGIYFHGFIADWLSKPVAVVASSQNSEYPNATKTLPSGYVIDPPSSVAPQAPGAKPVR